MEWLNLHASVLDSPEFVGEEPVNQATWIKLLRFCMGQENGGRISQCREWADRKWQQLIRVTEDEVTTESALWRWDGADLIVWEYPLDKEREVRANRENGRRGGRPKRKTDQKPGGFESVNPDRTDRIDIAETEGNGKEGNEREREVPAKPADSLSSGRDSRTISDRIIGLRPEWGKPAQLTHVELHAIADSRDAMNSLDDEDWKLLGDYLGARIANAKAFWQPPTRSRLIENFADVMAHAARWKEKGRPGDRSRRPRRGPSPPKPAPKPSARPEDIATPEHAAQELASFLKS